MFLIVQQVPIPHQSYVVLCKAVVSVVFFHRWLTGQLNVHGLSLPLDLGPLNWANFPHAVLSDYIFFKVLQILVISSLLPFSQSSCLYPSLYYSLVWNLLQVWAWKDKDKEMNLLVRKRNTLGMLFPLLWFLRGIPTLIKALVFNSLAERDYKMKLSQSAVRCRWDEEPSDISIRRDS